MARISFVSFVLVVMILCTGLWAVAAEPVCLVLRDSYVSQYEWGSYQELSYPSDHPGHYYGVAGMIDWPNRFSRYLPDFDVRVIDLQYQRDALHFDGVDLIILDDVRQEVCDPFELALVEYVRQGGALLIYAGSWSLGSRPADEYMAVKEIPSYQHQPLTEVIPAAITQSPDLKSINAAPQFNDADLIEGMNLDGWKIFAAHDVTATGHVLATVGGYPFIVEQAFDAGRVILYNADDLGWVSRNGYVYNINPYAATLWQRLAYRAMQNDTKVTAAPDSLPELLKPAAMAHPDQLINFLWKGYVYYRGPENLHYFTYDLLTHSVNLCQVVPASMGDYGIQSWEQFGVPITTKTARENPETFLVDQDGNRVTLEKSRHPQICVNNPLAIQYMLEKYRTKAAEYLDQPHVTYGHMGDETEFDLCYCEHCQKAFQEQYGYPLPHLKADFSPEYLDQWINYHVFRNQSIARMYEKAMAAAKEVNPRLKMFASVPQVGGMVHGTDLVNTQAPFDIIWEHTYPGTMIIRQGLTAQLCEDAAMLQGRPYVPVLNLLQGFDSYDRFPAMPPAEYMRNSVWQAVGHGIDSIGWFVYNAFAWVLPGTEAWDECRDLAHDFLEPMTPTLYQMTNTTEPVGLMWSYSQEAVDGLKEKTMSKDDPWQGVIRWWTSHATQEAYEVLKYAHIPVSSFNEYRLWHDEPLPYRAIVLPYVEHLHHRSMARLQQFIADGGQVFMGQNSTLDLPGAQKLPFAFDAKFNTWWPKDNPSQWNQRRARQYVISLFLEKARHLPSALKAYQQDCAVQLDDPEVVFSRRQAGDAHYLFVINDHQINPTSPEMRRRRQRYNHFMLMPMTFPAAQPTLTLNNQTGVLYPLFTDDAPVALKGGPVVLPLDLAPGGGQLFVILPEPVDHLDMQTAPTRSDKGVSLSVTLNSAKQIIAASVPLKIDITDGVTSQVSYDTTVVGRLDTIVPYLRDFPADSPLTITVTDLLAHKSVTATVTP